jgi:ceramide synthetase
MAKDATFVVFGPVGGWVVTALVLAAGLAITFGDPGVVGRFIMPAVESAALLAQSIARQWIDPTLPADRVGLWAVLPMTVFLFVLTLASRSLVAKLVRRFMEDKATADKFGESLVRGSYYFFMFCAVYEIATSEGFWPDASKAWEDTDGLPGWGQRVSVACEAYYAMELAYYLSGIAIHVWVDAPLKDFYLMLTHHIVTVGLVLGSRATGYLPIGMIILLCHDVSDIFLDFAKCFHYFKMEILSTVTFVVLLVSWVKFRLYLYPFVVLDSVLRYCTNDVLDTDVLNIYLIGLYFLAVLHWYWFYLMLRVAYRRLTLGEMEGKWPSLPPRAGAS